MSTPKRCYPLTPTNSDTMPAGIEDTLIKCDVCGRPGWITKAQLLAKTFNGGDAYCWKCLADAEALVKVHYVPINRGGHYSPRRR